jgi:hypothetical protein
LTFPEFFDREREREKKGEKEREIGREIERYLNIIPSRTLLAPDRLI